MTVSTRLHLALILGTLLVGCRQFELHDYRIERDSSVELPPLRLTIVGSTYLESYHQWLIRSVFEGAAGVGGEGEASGEAIIRLTRFEVTNYTFTGFLSAVLLMLPALFGVPWATMTADIAVDLEILDATGHSVAFYEASGHDLEFGAMYYGFGPLASAAQVTGPMFGPTSMGALEKALQDLRRQLEGDAASLRSRLAP